MFFLPFKLIKIPAGFFFAGKVTNYLIKQAVNVENVYYVDLFHHRMMKILDKIQRQFHSQHIFLLSFATYYSILEKNFHARFPNAA